MAQIEKILKQMTQSPQAVRFSELVAVCDHFFSASRQSGSSHKIYKTPWVGDPRINIQEKKGMAKPYQVKQVLEAIARMQGVEK